MDYKEQIRQIKSDFFSLRNGEIADTLRKAGNPYKIIFGLQMPQLEQIAARHSGSAELAELLWQNNSTRESKIIATMIYPREAFSLQSAEKWASETETYELVDNLCFRLVRYVDGAEKLMYKFIADDDPIKRYFALRLGMNLLIIRKFESVDKLETVARNALDNSTLAIKRLAGQIVQEIEFLKDF